MKTGKLASIILFMIFLFGGSPLLFAQPNSLYFMKGIPQTKDLNPARPGISDGYYFSMPLFSKLDLSVNTNNWAYTDLIHWGTGLRTDSLVIDPEKFKRALDSKNFINESAALTVFEGGFKKGKDFYAASITEREFTEFSFSKNLVNFIQFGNYPYVGQTFYSGNLAVNSQHYREFAFNYSHDVDKKLTIGGAAKILFGMAAVQTNGMNFKITSPANGEYLDVTASGRMNISAPVQFNYSPGGKILSVNSLSNYSGLNYMANFKNPGIAFDFGFAYHATKKTEISASIIDLGLIGWRSNTTRFTEQGYFRYNGVSLNDPLQNPPVISQFSTVIDSITTLITNQFRPTHTNSGFATLLPVKIYLGIDHQLNDFVSISGLTRIRIMNNTVHTSFTASANALLGKVLSLSASYSIMESTYDNLGLGVGIRAGAFQIYTAADNIISPFYPSQARNMNFRIGINFIFGDKDSSKSSGSSGSNCHCPY